MLHASARTLLRGPPWPEKGQDLRLRMASAFEVSDGDDRDLCFWIQLVEYFAR